MRQVCIHAKMLRVMWRNNDQGCLAGLVPPQVSARSREAGAPAPIAAMPRASAWLERCANAMCVGPERAFIVLR